MEPMASRMASPIIASGLGIISLTAVTAPSPAFAQTAPTYSATLEMETDRSTIVAGNTAWRCAGSTCTTSAGKGRAERMCRDLVRKAGSVTRFAVKGEALDADALAHCNR